MSRRPHLLVRADAGPRIGIGHLMRSLALAQAWADHGGEVTFACAELPPSLRSRLAAEGFSLHRVDPPPGTEGDAALIAELAGRLDAFLALDGYAFDPEYQRIASRGAAGVLVVSDRGRPAVGAVDLVLDQNLGASPADYPQPLAGRALLGPRYALLRREIRAAATDPREREHPPKRLLLTLGGSDQGDLLTALLREVDRSPATLERARAVVGPASASGATLEESLAGLELPVELVVDPNDMTPHVQWADMAVSAAGSTVWELACLGVPTIAIPIAENQEPVARALREAELAIVCDASCRDDPVSVAEAISRLVGDEAWCARLRHAGMTTVDGQGAERAAVAIHRVVAGVPEETLILRSVTAADSRILWSWANDPEVRAASFTSDPIPWATHRAWFRSRLEDPTNRTYLAIGPFGEPLGQIRFDLRERNAELGISLAPEARGRGIGPQLLDLGVARLFRDTAVERVHAFVKPDNRASLGAFRKAGFRSLGAAVEQGHPCEHFLRERTDVSPGDPVS